MVYNTATSYSFNTFPSFEKYVSDNLYVGAGKRSKVHKSYVHSAKKWVERYKDHSEGSLSIPVQPRSWGLVYKHWGGRLTVAEAGVISPGLERIGDVGQKKPATWVSCRVDGNCFYHSPPSSSSFLAAGYTQQSTTPPQTQRQRPRWEEVGPRESCLQATQIHTNNRCAVQYRRRPTKGAAEGEDPFSLFPGMPFLAFLVSLLV